MVTKRWRGLTITVVTVLAAASGTARLAYGHAERQESEERGRWSFPRERLTGYQEDPLALSTSGSGRFALSVDEQAQQVGWQLSYTGLEGAVTQAHIHLGGRAQSGGISVFLCTNLDNGPSGTQRCPASPATISGTIRPADVLGPAAQGIAAGEFGEFLAAARAGASYVNVHSSLYPGGEIRAQLGRHHHWPWP